MKIEPASTKKKLLYSVGVLCASLTSCDDNPLRNLMGRQSVPGIVPRDNPPAQPEETPGKVSDNKPSSQPEESPQLLGGDVPYIPAPADEPENQEDQPGN